MHSWENCTKYYLDLKGANMRHIFLAVLMQLLVLATSVSGQDSVSRPVEFKHRIWTDKTGKHTVLAKFVRLDGPILFLEKSDQKVIQVSLMTLSAEDQSFARQSKKRQRIAVDFSELKRYESDCATAAAAVVLYESFIQCEYSPADEVKIASEILDDLKRLAKKDAVRINSRYLMPEEAKEHRQSTEALVVAAVGVARAGDIAKAKRMLEKAEREDESSIHASFILAMTDAIDTKQYSKAQAAFSKCISRSAKFKRVYPGLKPNHAAALQNLATLKIRDKEFSEALTLYDEAFSVDPQLAKSISSNLDRTISMMKASAVSKNSKPLVGGEQTIANLAKKLKFYSAKGAATKQPGWCYVAYLAPAKSSSGSSAKYVKLGSRNVQLESGCFLCSGLGTLDCANRKCAKGTVRVPVTRTITMNGQTQVVRVFVGEKCKTCSGQGRRNCPNPHFSQV